MLAKVFGSAVIGVDALTITLETDTAPGFGYVIVGLPDNAVKESIDRVFSSLKNSDMQRPRSKLVINMAPADLKKAGSAYDLPIAIGILGASGQIPLPPLADYVIMGELSLDGSVQPVKGALPMALRAQKEGFKGMILPSANAAEASMVTGLDIFPVAHLKEVVPILRARTPPKPALRKTNLSDYLDHGIYEQDFSEVKGQATIKRALEIAAAGGHNVLLIGPPGAGKTMLAKRMPGILPPLDLDEALETTKIHSVAGKLPHHVPIIGQRPFRSPHHTISDVALVGGGSHPQPGEISLAHNGVLFLDELPEFKRAVLEVMRQPMEERKVTISRSRLSIDFPSNFMLLASMNPCPCGYYNHPDKSCQCAPMQVKKYLNKVSGPLLDRIDLHVEVTPVPFAALGQEGPAETSRSIRERVIKARGLQKLRLEAYKDVHCNAMMSARSLQSTAKLCPVGKNRLQTAMEKLSLSARAYDRIVKVARTIADLADSPEILPEHIAEAIQFRSLDREGWGA